MADGGEVIFKFKGDDSALKKTLGGVGKLATTALKGIAVGTAAVAAGFAGIVTASVKARGEMEQLEGGVKKIFGDEAQTVMDNAAKAFQTAGVSANDYLNQVTSFSASLIQSLKGDTIAAANIADRAVQDMADNANTFGTSIESIQNAYQGFAKGNYTMLDNLKLGYGGTKTEMQRLVHEASKMKDIQRELNLVVKDGDLSFANIAKAISVVQKNMNIMGTTEAEAMNTLTGSINATKAAWDNFLAGTGDLGSVVDSASVALDNVVRILDEIFPQLSEQIDKHMPQILELVSKVLDIISAAVEKYAPQIAEISFQIMQISAEAILKGLPTILLAISDLISQVELALADASTKFADVSFTWLANLATGIMRGIGNALLAISNLIGAVFQAIVNFNDKIWQGGFNWIMKLIEGIKSVFGKVKDTIGQIIDIVKNAFNNVVGQARKWGSDMITGFANGIQEKLGALLAKVQEVTNGIRSRLHFSRPDEGPLRDYETWMPDMIKGMAESLNRAKPMLLNEINDLASAMSMSPTLNGGTASYNPSMNIVVNNTVEQDPLGQIVNQIKTFSNGAKNDYNYGYGG